MKWFVLIRLVNRQVYGMLWCWLNITLDRAGYELKIGVILDSLWTIITLLQFLETATCSSEQKLSVLFTCECLLFARPIRKLIRTLKTDDVCEAYCNKQIIFIVGRSYHYTRAWYDDNCALKSALSGMIVTSETLYARSQLMTLCSLKRTETKFLI